MQNTTTTDVQAAFEVLKAVAEAIRELGEVPSGHLYARMMDHLSLAQFEQVLGVLKGAGLVRESNAHLLTWIGPAFYAPAELAMKPFRSKREAAAWLAAAASGPCVVKLQLNDETPRYVFWSGTMLL